MPMRINNIQEIMLISREKQQLEADVSKSVYKVFDSGEAILTLRKFIRVMVNYMTRRSNFKALKDAIDKESELRVWNKITKSPDGLKYFVKNNVFLNRLDATDCADLIRLSGEWVERGGHLDDDRNLNDIKKSYRKGLPEKRFSEQQGSGQRGPVGDVWAQRQGHLGSPVARRDRGDDKEIELHLKPFMRDPGARSGMGGPRRAKGNSTIKKLDNLFGFIIGCDISGTTTDNVFAFDHLNFGPDGLNLGYYIFPLATIIHNNHHTTLEVAMSLSLDEKIDYRIGFYETLLPKGGLPNELSRIENIYREAANKARHKRLHILCYYDNNNRLEGAYRFNSTEVDTLRATLVGTEVMKAALNMSRFPKEMEVKKLLPGAHGII